VVCVACSLTADWLGVEHFASGLTFPRSSRGHNTAGKVIPHVFKAMLYSKLEIAKHWQLCLAYTWYCHAFLSLKSWFNYPIFVATKHTCQTYHTIPCSLNSPIPGLWPLRYFCGCIHSDTHAVHCWHTKITSHCLALFLFNHVTIVL